MIRAIDGVDADGFVERSLLIRVIGTAGEKAADLDREGVGTRKAWVKSTVMTRALKTPGQAQFAHGVRWGGGSPRRGQANRGGCDLALSF